MAGWRRSGPVESTAPLGVGWHYRKDLISRRCSETCNLSADSEAEAQGNEFRYANIWGEHGRVFSRTSSVISDSVLRSAGVSRPSPLHPTPSLGPETWGNQVGLVTCNSACRRYSRYGLMMSARSTRSPAAPGPLAWICSAPQPQICDLDPVLL